eukprot:1794688-Ditylum_brightwellii.AAC.1
MITPRCQNFISLSDPANANIMTTPTTSMIPGLTRAETNIFFISPTSMDVTKDTLAELGKEGINKAKVLVDFDQDTRK